MPDQADYQAKVARAHAMRHWAEGDGGLFEVFAAIEAQYIQEWMETEPEDSAAREAAYHRVNVVRDIHRACELVIQDGKDATEILNHLNKRAGSHVRPTDNASN